MATMSNASSRYQDIISKSRHLSSGSLAVYQLKPKEDKFETLTRRRTVGEKNLNKKNKTILLVGETGTGKSTLINALVNYTMGVKYEDKIWFEIIDEENNIDQSESQTSDVKRGQSESQTSDVIVYEIFGYEGKTLPYSLTIIDTPGFGNTRGIKEDDFISQRLLDLFRSKDGVHEIDAVGLVMKATENRVSDWLKYILDSVTSLFGKAIEKNIVPFITHSSGQTPKNVLKALEAANIKYAKDQESKPVYFLFDNCQTEDRTKNTKYLEYAHDTTTTGMGKFKGFLDKSKPQKLETTVEVMNTRIRLTACIHNLKDRIQLIELKQREIQQIQEAVKDNEEITVEVEEVYKEKEDIKGGMWGLFYKGAVTCNICKETCHYPGCTMARKPEHCEVIKRGKCTVCINECPPSDHVKEKWIYVTKTRKVKKTLKDVKEIQTEMEKLKAKKIKLLDEVYQHVEHLEQNALNVNSLSTHVHLDFLIEKMKETGDTEKVKKLEEMKSRTEQGTAQGNKYKRGCFF